MGVVSCQIRSGSIKRARARHEREEDDRISSDIKGVSYSYKRKSVRATGLVDGKVTTKYFRVNTPEELQETMQEAAAWLVEKSGSASSGIVPVGDQSGIDPLQSGIAPLQDASGCSLLPCSRAMHDSIFHSVSSASRESMDT